MTLVTILLCMALQHFTRITQLPVKRFLDFYLNSMRSLLKQINIQSGFSLLLGLVLPILFIVGGIDLLSEKSIGVLFQFLLGIVVLLMCLGDYHLTRQKEEDTRSPREILDDVGERLFSVIFWFVILGPTGALAYYLITHLQGKTKEFDDPFNRAVWQARMLLDWLPQRMIALSYILVGRNLKESFSYFRGMLMAGFKDTAIARTTALMSLGQEPNQSAVADLILRAQLLWFSLIAFFTLGAWLS